MNGFEKQVVDRWSPLNGGRGIQLLTALDSFVVELCRHELTPSVLPSQKSAIDQIVGYLEFAFRIYVAKFREFGEVAIYCINCEYYVMLATCLRNMLEHAGMLHYYLSLPEMRALREHGMQEPFSVAVYDRAIKALDKFVRGNTFQWDAWTENDRQGIAGKPRASAGTEWQVPVARTALQELYRDVPPAALLYNLLCDMVHPNAGGHMLTFRASGTTGERAVGGNTPKTPAFDVATKPMAYMMALYPVILADLERLHSLGDQHGGKPLH